MTTWVKVYNSAPGHPKMLAANAGQPCSPGWLWVCGLCYSNEHLTDGFIAAHALPVVAPGMTKVAQAAEQLVGARLWHVVEGGWRIHEYDEVQRSSDTIRERRAADAKRKSATRHNGSPRNVRAESDECPSGLRADIGGSPTNVRDLDVEGREQKAEKKKDNTDAELRSAVAECFAYWQDRCDHPQATLTDDRRRKLTARLRERSRLDGGMPRAIRDVRQAIDGAAKGAFVNDAGKRFDDLELVCRTGSKLEDFMGRANAPVVPFRRGVNEGADILREIHGLGGTA